LRKEFSLKAWGIQSHEGQLPTGLQLYLGDLLWPIPIYNWLIFLSDTLVIANPNVIGWVSFLICHWRHSRNFHSLTNCWLLEGAKRLGVHVVFLEVGIGICAKNCLRNFSNGMNNPCKTLWNFFYLNWNLKFSYSIHWLSIMNLWCSPPLMDFNKFCASVLTLVFCKFHIPRYEFEI